MVSAALPDQESDGESAHCVPRLSSRGADWRRAGRDRWTWWHQAFKSWFLLALLQSKSCLRGAACWVSTLEMTV